MHVLVVEDNEHTRSALSRLLKRWGYDVTAAENLQNGLKRLNAEPIDVLLSDIALPDGTGYALVSEARRRGKDLLAIALSGYDYPSEVRISKLTGFDHHLSKPCDCRHLRSLLEDRIDSRVQATGGDMSEMESNQWPRIVERIGQEFGPQVSA